MSLNRMPYIVNVCIELQKYLLPTKFRLILKMFVCGDSNSKFEFLFSETIFHLVLCCAISHVYFYATICDNCPNL